MKAQQYGKAYLVTMLGLLLSFACLKSAWAIDKQSHDYELKPQKIAADTYAFIGRTEDFSRQNGGYIVNTGFIVTDEGVVVIDTGPSRRFAEQQRAAIKSITDQPIARIYLTHHHPDHFLGNQVYADVPIYALPATKQGIQAEGEGFSSNMYRMVGDWMRGTELSLPTETAQAGMIELGGHKLELLALQGHTAGDLMLFDHSTGVLFAGDLVFNQRTATTPHADTQQWLASLAVIQALPFKVLVPGHGAVSTAAEPIEETRRYLIWLEKTLQEGAKQGLSMTEIMQTPVPEQFQHLSLLRSELQRSVTHLYPQVEAQVLKAINWEKTE